MKILITPTSLCTTQDAANLAPLRQFADEIIFNPYGHPLDEAELMPLLDGIDGYLAGLDFITESVIRRMPASLKVISRYGAGYERVDVQAAAERGIVVTCTPGANAESVADMTFALLLAVARDIPALDRRMRVLEWPRQVGVELFAKKIGILGLGAIGRRVAQRASGFSMSILAYDPFIDMDYAASHQIQVCSLRSLLEQADFISLNLPLNEQTRNILSTEAFSWMKPGAIVINTARGGLIDEAAACEALASGRLGGLGLDAFEKEPPGPTPLFEMDHVVVSPHAGAHTREAVDRMAQMAIQNLIDVLSGRDSVYKVTGT